MEALIKKISTLVSQGLLSKFMVGPRSGNAINISHILFVDNTLIFSGANHVIFATCIYLFLFFYALKQF